jgi:hypothetical protein
MVTPTRIRDLDAGTVMVVTDLHGDWSRYRRYRDRFLALSEMGCADILLLTGDLIHREGSPATDRSLEILLDLIELRDTLGDRLVVLLGNHEMPHLYHVTLAKGDHVYTPRFEAVLGIHREAVLAFLGSLPFFVRTRGGVTFCHAGAFPGAGDPDTWRLLRRFSHKAVLQVVEERLLPGERPRLRRALGHIVGAPYDRLAREALAVTGSDDPRYDDYLIGTLVGNEPAFELLWSVLFSTNEQGIGMAAYTAQVEGMLRTLSGDYAPQRALVTGHIGCRGGYRILAGGRQMRVASGSHAYPPSSAKYLLVDAAQPVSDAWDLREALKDL